MKTFTREEIDAALKEEGISLEIAPPPAAAYLPFVVEGKTVYTAGQIATKDGVFVAEGIVGDTVSQEDAERCARQCAINVLAQLYAACEGDLSRIKRLVKLTVFVASAPGFTNQHLVANHASKLMTKVLGAAGVHARSAVGVAILPLGSPVEVEAIAYLH